MAELNDLIPYEEKHEDEQTVRLALNEPGNEEKEFVLSYIKTHSKKNVKTFNRMCGRCHITPETEELQADEWEDLIVILDGNMSVFSKAERSSIIRYLQTFAKK